ncbi:hypothetical protein FS749_003955 [Ceratobasidium sp. UAMH 11750]|nr:hypothetical protein FS749_003955 [Ceratobasidium sp. UAMH 11750]
MSYPLTWASWAKFYPMGMNPATSLTQDLSPEQSADILMLGCGDPRHILYTISTDVTTPPVPRKLDITCCDIEPAVLARNIMVFTLLEDDMSSNVVWDIFYHFKLTEHVFGVLTNHARKLVELSETIETWRASKYGSFLKFVDGHSLVELRRYWTFYAEFPDLPSDRLAKLKSQQTASSSEIAGRLRGNVNVAMSRSATILWRDAAKSVSDQFGQYWKNGTTATTNKDIQKTTTLNPTFCYSSTWGEAFDIYDNTFPQGYHFAPAFALVEVDPVGSNVTSAMAKAKQQFKATCLALQASRKAAAITLRFFVGDAIALCKAFGAYAKSSNPKTELFTAPWYAAPIDLTEHVTSSPSGPVSFDIIDTSLLAGLLGMINILLITQPLLKKQPASQAIMYMDVAMPASWSVENLVDRLGNDLPTIGILFGLVPRPAVSVFAGHFNMHEISIDHNAVFIERIAWVDPTWGDKYTHTEPKSTSHLHGSDLSKVVFSIYREMFNWDCVSPSEIQRRPVEELRMYHPPNHDRASVAAIWAHAQSRLHIVDGSWENAVINFMGLVKNDRENWSTPTHNADLKLQLYLHGLPFVDPQTKAKSNDSAPSAGVFDGWPDVPRVVCVVLIVPRAKLDPLRDDRDEHSPRFVCNFRHSSSDRVDTHSSIHAAWGRCVPLDDSADRFTIEEDPDHSRGRSDLIVSFWVDSRTLLLPNLRLSFALRFTPLVAVNYGPKTGPGLDLFATNIGDKKHVLVLRERPMGLSQTQRAPEPISSLPQTTSSGSRHQITVTNKEDTDCVQLMETQLDIESQSGRSAQIQPTIAQIGACTVKVLIGKTEHIVRYPHPIRAVDVKTRVDKKAHQVHLTTPFLNPIASGSYPLDPFPLLQHANYSPWNLHHVFLDRMPKLTVRNPAKLRWLVEHTAFQLSERERFVQYCTARDKRHPSDVLVNIKETLAEIIQTYAGLRQTSHSIFGLQEPSHGIYMTICVGGLRLDLAAGTVVLDAAVIPWSLETAKLLNPQIRIHEIQTMATNVTAWKRLMAACVERCRSWSHSFNCEYKSTANSPLSTRLEGNSICSCGRGVGLESPEWKAAAWEALLPYATRAAISPLFGVPYVDLMVGPGMKLQDAKKPISWEEPKNKCWQCGRSNRTMTTCGKCKKARYCSRECQRKHLEVEHQHVCKPPEDM